MKITSSQRKRERRAYRHAYNQALANNVHTVAVMIQKISILLNAGGAAALAAIMANNLHVSGNLKSIFTSFVIGIATSFFAAICLHKEYSYYNKYLYFKFSKYKGRDKKHKASKILNFSHQSKKTWMAFIVISYVAFLIGCYLAILPDWK